MSLAGRYCVLMPNTGRGGGISRKITNAADRKRLKKVATELDVPPGMGLIVRTAGAKRTKTEIKRDYEYLIRAWETIRDTTLRSVAPALIYEESSLVKRAIRDLYDKDVEDIHVEGEAAYKEAKDFVRMLMPSHAKKVQAYKEPTPIFTRHGVERQLETIFSPTVTLKSGGYIVINQTEALVAIDVNSGRATRERNIEQTALKTNIEAAEEAARQMRLRDLAGLVVLDFIDMEEAKNDRLVEKKMKDCLRFDRARVQMGKISPFGLLELSRQRRRTGILEGSSHICPQCAGLGRVRSIESSALRLLRTLDDESLRRDASELLVRAPTDVALYILNEKRAALATIEENRTVRIRVVASSTLMAPDFEIASSGQRELEEDGPEIETPPPPRAMRSDHRRDTRAAEYEPVEQDLDEVEEVDAVEVETPSAEDGGDTVDGRRRRRRGRRGGKRRAGEETAAIAPPPAAKPANLENDDKRDPEGERNGSRRRRRRRGRGRRPFEHDGGEYLDALASDPVLLTAVLGEEPDEAGDEFEPEFVQPTPDVRKAEPAFVAADPHDQSAPEQPAAEQSAPIVLDFAAVHEPVPDAEAEADAASEPEPSVIEEDSYEPDLEKRKKFLARFSRWGKKA
jgi:ribonuclease E